NHQPGASHKGETGKATACEMDGDPSADNHDAYAARDPNDRPFGPTRCLKGRRQSQSRTKKWIGEADDNEILGGQRTHFGAVSEQARPCARRDHAKQSDASSDKARETRGD